MSAARTGAVKTTTSVSGADAAEMGRDIGASVGWLLDAATRAGRVHELSRSSRSKFKMVLHQFSSVQFPSRQLAWKVRSVQFIEVLRF